MTTPGILLVLLALAFFVETLVEFVFGTLFDKVPALTPYKWALMYIAIVVGIVGTFLYRIDLLAILGEQMKANPPIAVSWYGMGITGIAIGKGSNYLHQFISRFFPSEAQKMGK